jgi:hypothetical protein
MVIEFATNAPSNVPLAGGLRLRLAADPFQDKARPPHSAMIWPEPVPRCGAVVVEGRLQTHSFGSSALFDEISR